MSQNSTRTEKVLYFCLWVAVGLSISFSLKVIARYFYPADQTDSASHDREPNQSRGLRPSETEVILSGSTEVPVNSSGANFDITVLNEFDSRRALVRTFSTALPYVRGVQCTEYSSEEGEGFNRELTILTSCRFSMEPRYFNRLSSELELSPDNLDKDATHVCPTHDDFSASEVYVSFGSIGEWDINTTAMYVNSAQTEYLACHKVMVVQ